MKRRTKLGGVAGLVLLLLLVLVMPEACRRVEAPWSLGDPALTGNWEGPLEARLGARYHLFLQLDYKELSGRRRGRSRRFWKRNNLAGTATLCTPVGQRWDYEVSGRADRDGTNVVLHLEFADPTQSALNLPLRGTWRGDRLELTAQRNPFLPSGAFQQVRTISSADPDDSLAPITLRHGDREALEQGCRAVAPR